MLISSCWQNSFSLVSWVESNALFPNTDHDIITSANNAIFFAELSVLGDLEPRKKLLENIR